MSDDSPQTPEPAASTDARAREQVRQRGILLAAARLATGLPQARLAARLQQRGHTVSDSTLSAWEQGTGGRSVKDSELDVALVVQDIGLALNMPTLGQIWRAVGSPSGLPARTPWPHNFAPAGGPVWVWARGDRQGDNILDLQWGMALGGRAVVPAGSGGLFVQFPASVGNPPLESALAFPGWVDFGTGQVPEVLARAVGAALVEAADVHTGHRPSGAGVDARHRTSPVKRGAQNPTQVTDQQPLSRLADHFQVRWELVAPHVRHVLSPRAVRVEGGTELAQRARLLDAARDGDGLVVTQLSVEPSTVARLRVARGLSQGRAAKIASSEDPLSAAMWLTEHLGDDTGNGLSRGTFQRLEKEGRLPQRGDHSVARIDAALLADGQLAVQRTYDSTNNNGLSGPDHDNRVRLDIYFPSWWVGPVWLQSSSTGALDAATVTLRWGLWTRSEHVLSQQVITTRKAAAGQAGELPLTVWVPKGWRVVAGVGAVKGAVDIGRDWKPVSLSATWEILRENVAPYAAVLQDKSWLAGLARIIQRM